MKNNDPSLIGTKYGRLTIIGFQSDGRRWLWCVKCDCGNEKVVSPTDVRNGKTKSCGCYHSESSRKRATKFSNHVKDNKRLYGIYNGMKKRCYSPKEPRYADYGGRGISICNEWMDGEHGFDNFVEWANANGYKDNLTIDRINVDGDYCPENCAWKTLKEQNSNKRQTLWVDYKGEHIQLRKLCDREGVSYDTVHNRIYTLGWDVEKAIATPSQQENSFAKKCREHGINPATAHDRIVKFGWTEEDALKTPSKGRGAHKGSYNR